MEGKREDAGGHEVSMVPAGRRGLPLDSGFGSGGWDV